MKQNYYYLVAGLPDLLPKEGIKGFEYRPIFEEIQDQLSESDAQVVAWLNYRFDNANLIALLEKSDVFDDRGVFSREELIEERAIAEKIPTYMVEFLEEVAEAGDTESDYELLLNEKYYRALMQQHSWLSSWAQYEVTQQNITAALSARRLGLSVEDSVVILSDVDEQIVKSSAADFGLSSQLPWLEKVISAAGDNEKLENVLDALAWEQADALAELHYFTVEAILSFIIKLNSIERWKRLDSDRGAARLDELLAELTSALPQS